MDSKLQEQYLVWMLALLPKRKLVLCLNHEQDKWFGGLEAKIEMYMICQFSK